VAFAHRKIGSEAKTAMNRRTLLTSATGLALASLLTPGAQAAMRAGATTRVRPIDAAWPSETEWGSLRETVGGALVRPTSPWAPCETSDAGACGAAFRQLRNPYYLGDQPGGTQLWGYLNAWRSTPSAYAIAARSSADVAAGVDFARRHNLRLVVKGGGHSYFGGSSAPDSLLIWTRAMKEVTLHDAFTPEGCATAPVPAVTIEAGAVWMDAYDAVMTKAGRYVQGGGCTTVGVAGLVSGGGFGSFSKRYGLAAASLLQAEVVTADGQIRTANTGKDPELFWALKGGGGSSFGVVTKLTLQTHDLPEWFGGVSGAIKASSDAAFGRLIARFVGFYAEALFNPHWGEQAGVRGDNVLKLSMVSQGLDEAGIRSIWKPLLDWIAAHPEDYRWSEPLEIGARPARRWWDAVERKAAGSTSFVFDDRPGAAPNHAWWSGDGEQASAFFHGYDSIWMPADLLAADQQSRLAEALVSASRAMTVGLHFNKGLAGAPAEAIAAAKGAATNPSVTGAFALAIIATGGLPPLRALMGPAPDLTGARKGARRIELAAAELRKVAPGAGSYVSESNFFNPDWQAAFWGEHYPRLRAIKARYDPGGLFFVHHGVGSEDWSEDGFTRTA
jgi:FAD binding domain/Berberine and berberine like